MKISKELDVANFIKFHLGTRTLLKQLFSREKRKAARVFQRHLESDQSPDSDISIEPEQP